MKRLALALLLLASPALAATHYVTPVSSFTWAESTNPATPCTLPVANANAVAGDVVQLYAGDYSAQGHSISPANHGSAGSYITYVGSLTSPYAVAGPLSLSKRYVSVKGISTTGASLSGNSDSVSYCTFSSSTGTFWVTPSTDVVVERNTLSLRQLATECNCVGSPVCVCAGRIERLTFRYNVCTINFTCSPFYEGPTFFKGLDASEVAFNFFDLTIGTGCNSGNHFRMIYHSANVYWHDNFWRMKNNGTTASLYARHMRDSTRFQSFARDTLVEDLTGLGHVKNTFNGSGNMTNTVRYSRTDSCLIDLGGEAYVTGDNGLGHSANANVFLSRSGRAVDIGNDLDSLTFTHNTVITANDNNARGAMNVQDNHTRTGWVVRSNIFYTQKTSTSPRDDVIRYEDNGSVFSGDNTQWSHNLYWAGTGSSEPRANYATYRSDTPQSLQQFFINYGREGSSRYASPRWADSTTFTWARGGSNIFLPRPESNTLFGPDGFVGAFNADVQSDITPPGAIIDLSGAALSATRTSLAWTEAGDDGFGNGNVASAIVKRAASQITNQAGWDAATTITTITGASLSSPGEQQTAQDNTVAASTTYWYAVRCADDAGNTGALGNSISITTPAAGDVTAPSAVADLVAANVGVGTVRLTWTAPGNDGAVGTASSYDMRRRLAGTFVEANWAGATTMTGEPAPAVAGTVQTMTVTGLANGTQYAFALKTSDATGNESLISNAAVITTQSVSVPFPAPAASSTPGGRWIVW